MCSTYHHLFRVILIGDAGVGKTSLLHRFCGDGFHTQPCPTIGIDFNYRCVEVDGEEVSVQLWDTAGEERWRSIPRAFYRRADGIMLVYDVTKEKTFRNLENWMRDVVECGKEDVDKIVIGNQCDEDCKRQVSIERGRKFANEFGVKFMETSAKASINVESAFLTLVRDIKKKREKGLETENLSLNGDVLHLERKNGDSKSGKSCC